MGIMERFLAKVGKEGECWRWTGYTTPDGYGRFQAGSRKNNTSSSRMAHRVAYELFEGPIPDGLEIDHLCNIRDCVNPEHLQAVTRQENIARSDAGKYNLVKTHCPNGHPYEGENLRVYRGRRYCRTCVREATTKYRLKKKLNHQPAADSVGSN